jgi:hypothetical protein
VPLTAEWSVDNCFPTSPQEVFLPRRLGAPIAAARRLRRKRRLNRADSVHIGRVLVSVSDPNSLVKARIRSVYTYSGLRTCLHNHTFNFTQQRHYREN